MNADLAKPWIFRGRLLRDVTLGSVRCLYPGNHAGPLMCARMQVHVVHLAIFKRALVRPVDPALDTIVTLAQAWAILARFTLVRRPNICDVALLSVVPLS